MFSYQNFLAEAKALKNGDEDDIQKFVHLVLLSLAAMETDDRYAVNKVIRRGMKKIGAELFEDYDDFAQFVEEHKL